MATHPVQSIRLEGRQALKVQDQVDPTTMNNNDGRPNEAAEDGRTQDKDLSSTVGRSPSRCSSSSGLHRKFLPAFLTAQL